MTKANEGGEMTDQAPTYWVKPLQYRRAPTADDIAKVQSLLPMQWDRMPPPSVRWQIYEDIAMALDALLSVSDEKLAAVGVRRCAEEDVSCVHRLLLATDKQPPEDWHGVIAQALLIRLQGADE
jgi:hypothetical protein